MPVFQAIFFMLSNHNAARIISTLVSQTPTTYTSPSCLERHPTAWSAHGAPRYVFFSSMFQQHPVLARPQSVSFPCCQRTPDSSCDQNEAPRRNYSARGRARTHTHTRTHHVRRAMYCKVTSGHVRVTTVAVEQQYYIFWVCVCSLSYPASIAHALYDMFIYGLSGSTSVSTFSLKWQDFRGKCY